MLTKIRELLAGNPIEMLPDDALAANWDAGTRGQLSLADRAMVGAWAAKVGGTLRFWHFAGRSKTDSYDVANVLFADDGECWQVFRPGNDDGVVVLDIACGIVGTRYACLRAALDAISTPGARARIAGT